MALQQLTINFVLIVGAGYGALKYWEMNRVNLEKDLTATVGPMSEAEKKRKQCMDVLKAAAENKLSVDKLTGKQDGSK